MTSKGNHWVLCPDYVQGPFANAARAKAQAGMNNRNAAVAKADDFICQHTVHAVVQQNAKPQTMHDRQVEAWLEGDDE